MRFMRISSVQIFSNRKQRLDEPLHPQLGEVLLSLKWMLAPPLQVAALFSVTSVLFLSALCVKSFSSFFPQPNLPAADLL
jgi:hypothetical protein